VRPQLPAGRVPAGLTTRPRYQRCNPTYKHECTRKKCTVRQKMTNYYRLWLRDNFELFLHGILCFKPELCGRKGCEHAGNLFKFHALRCKERPYGICHFCQPMMVRMAIHSRDCLLGDNCRYTHFYCKEIRERRLQGKPLFKNPYCRKQG